MSVKIDPEKFEIIPKTKLGKYLENTPLTELYERKRYYDDLYYNTGENHLDDFRYDLLKDAIISRDSNYDIKVGAKLRNDEVEVTLPYYLGSMDKVKPGEQKILDKWLINNQSDEYVIMDKLDGISCLLCTENNKVNLYTRADGITGKDISYIKPFINYIPENVPDNMNIRGELVMSKKNFEKLPGGKINPRNTVSGTVKAKTYRNALYNIDFVAYEVIEACIEQGKLSEQMDFLDKLGFRTVKREIFTGVISMNILSGKLEEYRKSGHYEIDGIIIQTNTLYTRNIDKNPKYAIAFKNDVIVQTEVTDVVWNITRRGFLKPVAIIKPVKVCGATLRRVTGYNAWFIQENKIGPGAKIDLVRSGDVIPKIIDVIKESPGGPKMPVDNYTWTPTHIDIIADDPGLFIRVKAISYFMATMKIKHVSDATVRKIVHAGYTTVPDILNMKVGDFEELDRFGIKLAERTYNYIHNSLKNVDMATLMTASNCFGLGIGIKRMKIITNKITNIIQISKCLIKHPLSDVDSDKLFKNIKNDRQNQNNSPVAELYKQIINIEGFSDKMTVKVILGLPKFYVFFSNIKNFISLKDQEDTPQNILPQIFKDEKIVCSGFRGSLDNDIVSRGGELVESVSKKTLCIVVKDHADNPTGKVKKALAYNIPVYDINEFTLKYLS